MRDILLIDPSLFTAPYDAALSRGLEAAGLEPCWATRALRAGEQDEIGAARRLPIFYPWTDGPRRRSGAAWRIFKGLEHVLGMRALARLARARHFDLVHFQWALLPAIDARIIAHIRRRRPVVLTVHDTTPFNGKSVARAQIDGFERLWGIADRLIVHTPGGRDALVARGIGADRIAVVPHGLLGRATPDVPESRAGNGRWRIVQFGKIQDYKGLDVLVEALGQLAGTDRARLQLIVAGEPLIDLGPVRARVEALGIDRETLEIHPHRHSEAEMEALLAGADAFVFPYRAIEASGVLFLVARRRRWIVASDLGAFAPLIGRDDAAGTLVPPGDPPALAAALTRSIGRVPTRDIGAAVPDWAEIGRMTREVYADAAASWTASLARAR